MKIGNSVARLVGGGALRALLALMVGALVALSLMKLAPHAQALGAPHTPNCAAAFTLSESPTGLCTAVSSVSYRVYLLGGAAPSYTTTTGSAIPSR